MPVNDCSACYTPSDHLRPPPAGLDHCPPNHPPRLPVMVDDDTSLHPDGSASPESSLLGAQAGAKTTKDRSCPFCRQAFTSSSLGRHLDLYIKPKNPKPPDGVHDVIEIRKIRGGITRRQPRSNMTAKNMGGPSRHDTAEQRSRHTGTAAFRHEAFIVGRASPQRWQSSTVTVQLARQ